MIVVILLILAAILGLTYLLYSDLDDEGTIGINITTGNCKIDIVDGEGNSMVGDVLDFVAPEGQETVFRPGKTFYTEGFSVTNVGNIPVKFRVSISEDEKHGEADFRNAFEVWITRDVTDLTAGEQLTSFTGELELGATTEPYYIVVRMKEEAGNEFQNTVYKGIGITVYAVQIEAPLG